MINVREPAKTKYNPKLTRRQIMYTNKIINTYNSSTVRSIFLTVELFHFENNQHVHKCNSSTVRNIFLTVELLHFENNQQVNDKCMRAC